MKKRKYKWEMLLEWNSDKHPMRWQKLEFYAGSKFVLAYKEAVKIRKLLLSVGDYSAKDMKLVGVAGVGLHKKMQEELGVHTRALVADILKVVKGVKALKQGKTAGKQPKVIKLSSIKAGPIKTRG